MTADTATAPRVSVHGINKTFGAIRALAEVDVEIGGGEVVALLGDNGAGKSTLVKILAGVYSPDSGSIEIGGRPVSIASPTEARALGIATVYQDLALCENLDVVANLFLGREEGRFALAEESMERHAWGLLRRLSARIPSVREPVASLSGGQRQAVAIARSLLGEPSVVILDEPTAALGVAQTEDVLRLVRQLADTGIGVLLITHNLADVAIAADRAIVLRLGRNNGSFNLRETSQEQLVAAITGASAHQSSHQARSVPEREAGS